ncbi:hypothetical protein CEXT_157131 [Caerostris extrusa]|uniref:Uncharacterized protein n=1 Tax=Caerostris extrusa TaxID=172846 RepID=A0AAV4Y0T5_CAEEX|nr:hypothetical protein CEXT_157131 [Caerostris extrusa]
MSSDDTQPVLSDFLTRLWSYIPPQGTLYRVLTSEGDRNLSQSAILSLSSRYLQRLMVSEKPSLLNLGESDRKMGLLPSW